MKKGFTLVELLVVIGILAILTAAVVVVLNPAELLRQSRDAQRLSDFDAVRSAVSLYLSSATTPTVSNTGYAMVNTGYACYSLSGTCTATTSTAIDGTGWVAINFSELSSVGLNSPLSALPVDPVNNATYHYAYKGFNTDKTYELNTILESSKYATGASNKMAVDGGNSSTIYEVGSDPGLDL